jgi:DNA-binding PadR family transcriptional regulator
MFCDHHPFASHPIFAIGRHGSRLGRKLGGGGFRGFGGDGVPGGRKLFADDLQLVVLALLEERPAHGYELIRAIEAGSGGFYTPSPGVIYPALTYLQEIGYAEVEAEGARKLYQVTQDGLAHLEANRARAEAILDALGRIGGRMEQVRAAFADVDEIDPGAGDELRRARHALKHALMRKRGCNLEEARRIATILERAAAEILGRAASPAEGQGR